MSKKSYLVLIFLSVLVNYLISIIDVIIFGSVVAGDSGVPLRYSHSVFGSGSIDYKNLFLDIVFWFIILLIVWKLFKKIVHK